MSLRRNIRPRRRYDTECYDTYNGSPSSVGDDWNRNHRGPTEAVDQEGVIHRIILTWRARTN